MNHTKGKWKAGKTNLECGTRIKTTYHWDNDKIITGEITHPFGKFGSYDYGAVAGIRIDEQYQKEYGDIGNLFDGDFEPII
jgi:hypothetical protein